MITQYSFSVVPEGNPLRRRWTVTVDRIGEERWRVCCDGMFVNARLELSDEPRWYDEHTALGIAERAASEVKLWTQYGEMTAAEAMEAGLR